MSNPVRLALVGIDHPHAAGYRETVQQMPEVEIVGLYDPDPASSASQLDEPLWRLPLYSDLEELLRRERPEAALIALPNDATPQAIIACAQAGVHVFAEKPCARTAAEFLLAAEALERAGVQFCTGYARRIMPIGQMIKSVVDEGLLGRLVSIEARWIATSVALRHPEHFLFSQARSGGGMLHWLGSHWLDLMRWCTSSEVAEVAATLSTSSDAGIDVEDTASLALRYDNGMLGSLHCAYVTDRSSDQLYFGLRGTQGWLHWERSGPELVVHSTHPAWAAASTRTLRVEADTTPGYLGAGGVYMFRRFFAAFREGAEPLFRPVDALRVLEVLDAAHASERSGRRITPERHTGTFAGR
ncbi:MAG: Gfo/Idh/MocA family protein [Anaerolineae bacterium]